MKGRITQNVMTINNNIKYVTVMLQDYISYIYIVPVTKEQMGKK